MLMKMPLSPMARRRLKRAALTAMVLSAIIAAAVALVRQRLISVAQPEEGLKTGSDGLVVERIHQTSTRDGRTEWSLEAASAQYLMPEKKIMLKDLSVTFFGQDGQQVFLRSRSGTVQTDSHDMEARDDVEIHNDLYRLETEQIQYAHGARMITSETPVKLTGPAGDIMADSLSVDLKTNRLVLKGNVHGTLAAEGAR
jgi:LPS export ABC transporter protein LptC